MKAKKSDAQVEGALAEYFLQQPDWPDLGPTALAVWAALWFMTQKNSRMVTASHRELATLVRLGSKSTVSRALRELRTKGYIRLLSAPGSKSRRPFVYHLVRGPGGERELSIPEQFMVRLINFDALEAAEVRKYGCI
jgi:hypothetical protein